MKQDNDPKAIQTHLEDQVAGTPTDEQLAFDPATGELRLVPRRAAADALVVDSITRDGFFAR